MIRTGTASNQLLQPATDTGELFQGGNPNQGQVGQCAGLSSPSRPTHGLGQHLHRSDCGFNPPVCSQAGHLLCCHRSHAANNHAIRSGGLHHQISAAFNQLAEQFILLGTGRQRSFESHDRFVWTPLHEWLNDSQQQFIRSCSQQPVDIGGVDLFLSKGQQLIKQRLAISHRPTRSSSNQFHRVIADGNAFGFGDRRQSSRDPIQTNQAEVEPLTSRNDRIGQCARLGCTKNELHVLGRFLEGLQQGVEGLGRQLVDLIDDVDLVGRPHTLDADVATQVTDIINPSIGCSVDFQHIHILAGRDAQTDIALVAGLPLAGIGAIECLGENSRHRRLADTAGTGKEVGMGHTAGVDSISQATSDVFLANHLLEGLRPEAAGQNGVVGRLLVHGARSILHERVGQAGGRKNGQERRERLSPRAPESQNA